MTNYNRLNNLFPNDQNISDVKTFRENKTYPDAVNTLSKQRRFETKYAGFDISPDGQNLLYTPLNLTVVPKTDLQKTLEKEYKNSFGSGIVNFYKTIREKYINIKRSDVSAFIKQQQIPQLTDVFKHRTNKPIVASYPNEIWCIDLIDMSKLYETKNRGFRYIMTTIDVFSRKIFLEATKLRESVLAARALDRVTRRADVMPKYIICDNGTEFQGDFETFCRAHDITIRRNRAYSPEANGIVERANKEIRKLLRNIMLENENNNWIDNLRRVEDLRNNTFTSAIKNIPNKIWTNSKEPIALRNIPIHNRTGNQREEQILAKQTILRNVNKQIEEFKDDELDVGDKVRIRMDALSNGIKALVKKQLTKQIVIAYSPVVFKVLKKIIPRNGTLERSRYIVGTVDQTRMLVNKQDGTKPRQFYANVLKKVGDDETDYKNMTMQKAVELSGAKLTINDVYSAPYNG
eukprot:gene12316-25904_t